jgi:hypothetical protein
LDLGQLWSVKRLAIIKGDMMIPLLGALCVKDIDFHQRNRTVLTCQEPTVVLMRPIIYRALVAQVAEQRRAAS